MHKKGEKVFTCENKYLDTFTKDKYLDIILALAAESKGVGQLCWSPLGGSVKTGWWLSDIDFSFIESKINDALRFTPTSNDNFYVFIEFWGKHKFYKVSF